MAAFMTKMELNDYISDVKVSLDNWRKLNYSGIDEPMRELIECLYHKNELTTIYCCSGHEDYGSTGYLMFHCSDETALKWSRAIAKETHSVIKDIESIDYAQSNWHLEFSPHVVTLDSGKCKWRHSWIIRFFMRDDELKTFLATMVKTANKVLV